MAQLLQGKQPLDLEKKARCEPPVVYRRVGPSSMLTLMGGSTISAEPSQTPSFCPKYCSHGPAGTKFCN